MESMIILTFDNSSELSSELNISQIFDLNNSSSVPFLKDIITFHIEAVEYNVEYNEVIDLGEIKGRTLHKINFDLINKGKSQIDIM